VADAGALYVREGDGYVGTQDTESTWDKRASAGGAVLALFGHVLEDVPTPVPMSLSRLTADLFRPVPLGRHLDVRTTVIREGGRIQVVDMVISADGTEHARARALRLRDKDVQEARGLPDPTTTVDPAAALLRPDDPRIVRLGERKGVPRFVSHGAELRRAPRADGGPYGLWLRLRVPVVAGEPVRPTSRLALATDFANVIGVQLDPAQVTTINPDVSAHVLRPPTGEWIAVVGDTYFAHELGRGISTVYLCDDRGVFGVASTCQLVQPVT
jgi:hypothetical protein